MAKVTARFADRPHAPQVRALGRLGDLDVFWNTLGAPLRSHIEGLISGMAQVPRLTLTAEETRLLSLVGVDEVRQSLPVLESAFAQLTPLLRATVISQRPSRYFAQFLPALLQRESAFNYRMAESLTRLAILPSATHLDEQHLSALLIAWAENHECRYAAEMPTNAVTLFQNTQHLRPGDLRIWRDFVTQVRTFVPKEESFDGYYHLNELATAIGM
ncbi:hypothetical protein ABCR94_04615 [Streptomyces sp. 21So2-11]|uniref:hypothetical protein n=1 Tax=Streptomyces sp. 21So2-11 TaxID=3144408 RepID=UPI00321C3BDC